MGQNQRISQSGGPASWIEITDANRGTQVDGTGSPTTSDYIDSLTYTGGRWVLTWKTGGSATGAQVGFTNGIDRYETGILDLFPAFDADKHRIVTRIESVVQSNVSDGQGLAVGIHNDTAGLGVGVFFGDDATTSRNEIHSWRDSGSTQHYLGFTARVTDGYCLCDFQPAGDVNSIVWATDDQGGYEKMEDFYSGTPGGTVANMKIVTCAGKVGSAAVASATVQEFRMYAALLELPSPYPSYF